MYSSIPLLYQRYRIYGSINGVKKFLAIGIGMMIAFPAHAQGRWDDFGGANGWKARTKPPVCASNLGLRLPIDSKKVTGVLHPGQTRGGNYKPHGGFRFDKSKNKDITVKIPLDASLVRASRYIEGGEVQYYFVFVSDCGIMYRFDHLLTLTPKFQAIANTLPAAKKDDSRTTDFTKPYVVKKGEVLATAVGFSKTKNVSVDFGLFDLRQKNTASKNASWARSHANDSTAPYGLCMLDMFSAADKKKLRSLPAADGKSGKKSDYCK